MGYRADRGLLVGTDFFQFFQEVGQFVSRDDKVFHDHDRAVCRRCFGEVLAHFPDPFGVGDKDVNGAVVMTEFIEGDAQVIDAVFIVAYNFQYRNEAVFHRGISP